MVRESKTRNRSSSRGEVRDQLLTAAIDAFAALGYEAVGPRLLCEKIGVNHSLVAYHFGSMNGLWQEAVGTLFATYRDRLRRRLEGLENLDVETRLTIAIEDVIDFSREYPMLHRIMTQEGRRQTDRLEWLIETHLQPMFEETTGLIRQGQEEGSIRHFDPGLLYYAIIGLAATPFSVGAEFEQVTGINPNHRETAKEIARMIKFLVFKAS